MAAVSGNRMNPRDPGTTAGLPDWNETTDDVRLGTGAESRAWAIRQLEANFPNRDGIPDRSREDATMLVDALLGKPHPGLVGWASAQDSLLSACEVVDYASSKGLLYRDGTMGWVDRNGRMMSCAYAAHEVLLYSVLGMDTKQAKDAGWVRVGLHARWSCKFKLSRQQRRRLASIGCVIDPREEKAKPPFDQETLPVGEPAAP